MSRRVPSPPSGTGWPSSSTRRQVPRSCLRACPFLHDLVMAPALVAPRIAPPAVHTTRPSGCFSALGSPQRANAKAAKIRAHRTRWATVGGRTAPGDSGGPTSGPGGAGWTPASGRSGGRTFVTHSAYGRPPPHAGQRTAARGVLQVGQLPPAAKTSNRAQQRGQAQKSPTGGAAPQAGQAAPSRRGASRVRLNARAL